MRIPGKLLSTGPVKPIVIVTGLAAILLALFKKSGFVLLEGALLILILALTLSLPPLRESVAAWPRRMRTWGTVLLILVLCGHLHGKLQDFFPFASWTMYSTGEKKEVVRYVEFHGQPANGPEVRFVGHSGSLVWVRANVLGLVQQMNNPQLPESKREKARRQFDQYGALILEVYNRAHPENPIRSFKVYENRKPLDAHPAIERILMAEWPLAKGQP